VNYAELKIFNDIVEANNYIVDVNSDEKYYTKAEIIKLDQVYELAR